MASKKTRAPWRSKKLSSSASARIWPDQQRILEDDLFQRVRGMIEGKAIEAGPKKPKPGTPIDDAYLADLPREQWFEIRFKEEDVNTQLETVSERLKGQRKAFEKRFEEKKAKITAGDDLAPGVLRWSRCIWQ